MACTHEPEHQSWDVSTMTYACSGCGGTFHLDVPTEWARLDNALRRSEPAPSYNQAVAYMHMHRICQHCHWPITYDPDNMRWFMVSDVRCTSPVGHSPKAHVITGESHA